jgi:coniferyl-aldehyde dehydrogenase
VTFTNDSSAHLSTSTQSATSLHLQEIFDRQRLAFESERFASVDCRLERLVRLREAVLDGQEALQRAVSEDFGHRSIAESRVAEIAGTVTAIDYAIAHVEKWMRPKRHSTSIWFLPASNKVVPQPIGVVGIIAPWNYPVNLALVPLAYALAAGNRAMVKMSELSPRTAQVLDELLRERFSDDDVKVCGGQASDAAFFSSLPFNHLFFTGSPRVGRMVMAAAAKNLTPVTLELGGKCPVIIDDDYSISEAAKRILWGKTFNAAQTCVAPDYVLVPRGEAAGFVEAIIHHYAANFPNGALDESYTSIIDQRNYDRLIALVDQARGAGAQIFAAERPTAALAVARKMPLTLVVNPPLSSRIMSEEVFGPLLPVIEHDGLEDALQRVGKGAHPLGLYYFGHSSEGRQRVVTQSLSGGVAINDVMLQFLQVDLPFGGVGGSGFGRYHGRAGFETFSHLKSVFVQRGVGNFTGLKLLYPPHGPVARQVIKLMGG